MRDLNLRHDEAVEMALNLWLCTIAKKIQDMLTQYLLKTIVQFLFY